MVLDGLRGSCLTPFPDKVQSNSLGCRNVQGNNDYEFDTIVAFCSELTAFLEGRSNKYLFMRLLYCFQIIIGNIAVESGSHCQGPLC